MNLSKIGVAAGLLGIVAFFSTPTKSGAQADQMSMGMNDAQFVGCAMSALAPYSKNPLDAARMNAVGNAISRAGNAQASAPRTEVNVYQDQNSRFASIREDIEMRRRNAIEQERRNEMEQRKRIQEQNILMQKELQRKEYFEKVNSVCYYVGGKEFSELKGNLVLSDIIKAGSPSIGLDNVLVFTFEIKEEGFFKFCLENDKKGSSFCGKRSYMKPDSEISMGNVTVRTKDLRDRGVEAGEYSVKISNSESPLADINERVVVQYKVKFVP